jgi:hypothetical protein
MGTTWKWRIQFIRNMKYYDIMGRKSSLMPGPMVVVKKALLIYCPLAPPGLALLIASTSEVKFSRS